LLAVDVIAEMGGRRVVLVKRKNPPYGYALPGGFVDYGETLEHAAARELKEETGLDVKDLEQFRAYSDPKRDPRGHTVSVAFIGQAVGEPAAGSDAAEIVLVNPEDPGGRSRRPRCSASL
jgi:8-oxo-dGTP diphosphatase